MTPEEAFKAYYDRVLEIFKDVPPEHGYAALAAGQTAMAALYCYSGVPEEDFMTGAEAAWHTVTEPGCPGGCCSDKELN